MSQSDERCNNGHNAGDAGLRIDELEVKVAFMEETIDTLNNQMAELTLQFDIARQAMQMMNRRIEQLQSADGQVKNSADEAPPPHY